MKNLVRFLLIIAVAMLPARLFAQAPQAGSSDVGVFVSWTSFEADFDTDVDLDENIDFDEDLGYGVSFNHYWTDLVSTEFAVSKLGADLDVSSIVVPETTIGELDVTALTGAVQFHFLRQSRIDPYVGGGVAWMMADFDPVDLEPDDEDVELEDKFTFLVNAGVNFHVTERFSLGGDVKYIPWEVGEENAPAGEDEETELSPLIVSAGVKFRF